MRVQRKIRMILAAGAALAVVGVSATAGATVFNGTGSTDHTPSTTQVEPSATSVPIVTPSTSGVAVSGPCDEAEHVNDPRCAGSVTTDDSSGSSSDDSASHSDDGHGRSGSDDTRSGRDDSDDRDSDRSGRGRGGESTDD